MGGVSFAPVPGFSKYVVSSDGRIFGPRRELKAALTRDGYQRVVLMSDTNVRTPKAVHRVVLEAFVGQPPVGTQCAHMDGDRVHNDASNLAWVTPAENSAHKILHGTQQRGELNPNVKLTADDVRDIRRRLIGGASLSGLAREYSVSAYAVRAIRDNKTWKHVA